MNLDIVNLTGHEINIIKDGEIVKTIEPSKNERPLRASMSYREIESVNDIPCAIMNFNVVVSEGLLNYYKVAYDGIIVSKLTAEALKKRGYDGDIYITGKNYIDRENGGVLGVKNLSLYI